MKPRQPSCPLTAPQVIDLYFVEHRAKLLDLAAFLDRVDRARGAAAARKDYRLRAMRHALALLLDGKTQRARRALDIFSDPTTPPAASALGLKAAAGAYRAASAPGPGRAPRRRALGGRPA